MGRGSEHKQEEVVLRDPMAQLHGYLHGGTSSLLSTIIIFPVHKTVFRQQLHSTLVRQAVSQLYREGPLKLYRGVAPPMLTRTLNGTLLFGLQDTLLHLLLCSYPSLGASRFPSALPALAGLGAGVVEALVFTPFERVQNVLQNGQNDRSLPTMRSVLARLRAERLASGYYRAFVPILVRNTLGSSLYFGLKDPMRSVLRERGLSPVVSSFVSGMANAMIISLPLYPMSVLVANMQATVGGKAAGEGLRKSWRDLWQSRHRNVPLLYRGGSLVILRSCISWGITTAVYDQLARHTATV